MDRQLLAAFVICAACWAACVADAQVGFHDVTEEAGLVEPLAGMMGHGAAWGDYDGDGWIDLFVGGFCDRPVQEYQPADGPVSAKLLRNCGDGTFEPVRQLATAFVGRTSGAVFADLDNNGTLELYAANNARPRHGPLPEAQRTAKRLRSILFRNDGGTLVDIASQSGACPETLNAARNVGVFDFSGDGLLDLLVVEDRFGGSHSRLFENLGELTFRDANRAAGLPLGVFGLGLAVADVNGDQRPDFFIPHSNRFFLSKGDGTYRESDELNRTFKWQPLHGEDWPCGAAFGDLNRDSRFDLVLAIHGRPARNRVYLNEGVADGVPRFRDVTREAGWPESLPQKCPHVEIQDFDNDGLADVYLSAGWRDAGGNVTPLVYRNAGVRGGVPRFETTEKPLPSGEMVYFPAGPSGDFDRDGRIDLFLVNWFRGDRCRLMQNVSPMRHWLDVRVVGRSVNRMGIGSQVKVYSAGQLGNAAKLLGFQELSIGYGYASGQPAVCHFGLGDESSVDVEVLLMNGKTVTRTGVEADQVLVVREPE
jgi:hypothetical protein